MDRVRGRRFDEMPKLDAKKVIATIIAIVVVIMVIVSIRNLFVGRKKTTQMVIAKEYFTIYQNGKYGVIDSYGNVVIKPSYDEMIVIPDSSKDIFWTCQKDESTGEIKTKVINSSNVQLFAQYNDIQPIENSLNSDIWYEKNIFTYKENGLYGLIDFSGNKVVNPEYTSIYALSGIENNIVIENNGAKGIVNSTLGNVVAESIYEEVSTLNTNNSSDGYIVKKDGKYGILNATGKVILDCNYTEIEHAHGNNMYVVNDGNGLKIIDAASNVVKDGGFDHIKSIDGENIIIEQGGLYGVVNISGEEKIPVQYKDLIYACDTYYIAQMEDLYGIVSLDNVVCLDFKYQSINYLNTTNFYEAENSNYTTDILNKKFEVKLSNVIVSELNTDKAYMRVRVNGVYKYYNFNFEEKSNIDVLKSNSLFLANKNGKYGYVNQDGELIVDYKYDDAREQNAFGYCAVKQNGLWGVLAQDGTVILKPSVNLDSSLYINFISSWHLHKEANLNVYVK